LARITDEVRRRWDTYFLLPTGAAHGRDARVRTFWRDLLGQNALELDDLDAACETIALTVGLGEDAIDLDAGLADLRDTGSDATATVSRALAHVSGGRSAPVRSALPAIGPGSPVERL